MIVYTNDGLFSINKQEIFKLGLNTKLNGWYCSSMLHSVTINNVGTATSPICNNFTLSHNIYDTNVPIIKYDNLICSSTRGCACEGDTNLPKAVDYDTCEDMLNEIFCTDPKKLSRYKSGNIIGMSDYGYAINNKMSIYFNVGKRCNFDCSYCPSHIHDNFSPFFTNKQILSAYSRLAKTINFKDKDKIITITGGEPTLQKEIVELCFAFINMGCKVNLLTNGTASRNKYKQMLDLGVRVVVTFHPEFTTIKIIKKVEQLKEEYGNLVDLKSMSYDNEQFKQFVKDNIKYYNNVSHKVILTRDESSLKKVMIQ